jgi:VWFA-related protein
MGVRPFAALALVLALGSVPASARQSQGKEDEVQLRGEEVLLDLVAVDGKGRPVLDLKPEEVEVYEDGQRQTVTSFGIVRVGPAPKDAPARREEVLPPTLARSPFRHFNLILIVVDRTSVRQTNLLQTYKAAERFIKERLSPNDLVAVFGAGRSLVMMQNFTNDKASLLEAMRRLTQNVEPLAEQLGDTASARVKINEFDDQTAPFLLAGELQPLSRQLNDLARFVDVTLNELRQQVQSRAILYDLLALTKVYSRVPGRKSVLLYSEGFAIDNATEGVFASAISAANRGNFVFYTVDAAGLRTELDRRPTTDELGRPPSGVEGDRTIVVGGNSGLGRAEKALRSDNDAPLERLAGETGGVALRNSNDLNRGFQAVEQDLRSYYALSYAPSNSRTDGTFHSINVRVARKGVEVRTRKGYYAVPGGNEALLLPYEQPVLAMLAAPSSPLPANLGLTVMIERFRGERGWLVPILMSVEGASLTPVESSTQEKDTPPSVNVNVDTVALVLDGRGNVVSKLSRPTSYRVLKKGLGELRGQSLAIPPFRPLLVLPPGDYILRIGAYDPVAKKGTVVERELRLPELPAGGTPFVSSLVLSRATEPIPEADREAASDDPLAVLGKVRVVPNMRGEFVKSRGDKLVTFLRLYAGPDKQYEAKLVFTQGKKTVIQTKVTQLPVTDARGEAIFAPILPLDSFDPGEYEVQVVILEPGKNAPVADAKAALRIAS